MFTALNNGSKFPLLGLGTYLIHSPQVEQMVAAAIAGGYRLIDTAEGYRNEKHIGETLKTSIPNTVKRQDLFITSKIGPSSHGNARETIRRSLEALQLDYLDLYLIHWPGASGMQPDDPRHKELRKKTYLQLEELHKEGLLKSIGVSNYTVAHLKDLLQYCTVPPAVLQIEVHPYLNQTEVRQFCNEHEIHVQAYSSLGSGKGCVELLSDPVVVQISKDTGKTCAQVLLRWAIQQGMSTIPKTVKTERIKENFNVFDFELHTDQIQALNQLEKNQHYCWDPNCIV